MFTPGPWKWSCHKQGDVLITRLGNEKTEAMVIYGSGTTICCHQHDQNLIAAAPEMYQMLRLMRNRFAFELNANEKKDIDELLSKIEN